MTDKISNWLSEGTKSERFAITRKPSMRTVLKRTIEAAQAAGLEVKSFRVEPDGAIVINGDIAQKPAPVVDSTHYGSL